MERVLAHLNYIIQGTTMTYNSLIFFSCLLLFLAIYFLIRSQRVKLYWILVANVVFYVWSGWATLWIVGATSVIVYVLSRRIGKIYEKYETEKDGLTPKEQTALLGTYKKRTRKYLWLGMGLILAVWIYVKVGKLMNWDSADSFRDWILGHGILVPLGISYYSLSSIGYLLDVFWRKAKAEKSFLRLAVVMTYFPHIVQGPISRYSKLFPQFAALPGFSYDRVCFGLQRMLWGYIKKLVIADRLIVYTSAVFHAPGDFAGMEIFLAVVLSVFQLYADFSGCMDIVCGISQVIGVSLDENFRQPLFSKSASEFWTRWHITLGAWTKEYIYLPIAMNPRFMKWTRQLKKNGKPWLASFIKALIPLMTVWLFTGLWHGTGWDYLVWGLYWCVLMTLAKETAPLCEKITARMKISTGRKYYLLWQKIRTCLIFGIGRTFTVTGSLSGCLLLWKQFFSGHRIWVLFDGSLYQHGLDQKDFYVALIGIILILVIDTLHEKGVKIRQTIAAQPLPVRWIVYYAAIFIIVILGIYGPGYNASSFVYGAF